MKRFEKYSGAVIVDLEATCCDQGSFPRDEMEIIEIGAVYYDFKLQKITEEHDQFIRPVRNSVLTSFCRQLTSITQEQVDAGVEFSQAYFELKKMLKPGRAFCSWGDYDRKQLQQDCRFHEIDYDLPQDHVNIKKVFAYQQGLKRPCGVSRALQNVGLKFEGTAHRAIDDVRNMARLMPWILGTVK